jgi:spermidine dehydrogenase
MDPKDRKLGMNRPIKRRDFLQGCSVLGAGALAASSLTSSQALASQLLTATASSSLKISNTGYPPLRNGMRGNHPGSFEVIHQLARYGKTDWGETTTADSALYDLVVVGGGISGLSAAYFYRKQNPNARILILDNHDDFGGHAKRNEFKVGDRTFIGYAGSAYLVQPSGYSAIVKGLMKDLGVNFDRVRGGFDEDFYKRHGLVTGLHFKKEKWKQDITVPVATSLFGSIPYDTTSLSAEESVAKMPISEAAKKQLVRLLTTQEDQIPHIKAKDKTQYLSSISYREFLTKHLNITEPDVFAVLQDLVVDCGLGIEAADANLALKYSGLPGFAAAGLKRNTSGSEPAVHRFPDGNGSIARLLVRLMIPESAPGNTMEDIVTAQFDYSKLDQPNSDLKIRLNSTVVNVQHEGKPASNSVVKVSYMQNGKAYSVRAKGCVLACNNSAIPYLCPELPEQQKVALADQVKQPIEFTNVVVRNWRPWKKMGIGAVLLPDSFHVGARLTYPINLGDYKSSDNPDQPTMVTLYRYPHINNQGLTAKQQYRQVRHQLMATSFETIERHVRSQLASLLGNAGFNAAEDIMAITVNRWAHGYAYDLFSHSLFDQLYDDYDDPRYPHMRARKPFGRITIANADSAASAMLESAVEQAHRAVSELLG